jgi:uncharacterized membrane protein YhhN
MALSFTLACLLAVAGLLTAEVRGRSAARAFFKIVASLCFVLVALALQAMASRYGQLVLLALALGAAGDACLLSRRSAAFLAGLAFFLLAHVAYALAFASGAFDLRALVLGLAAMATFGVGTLRWLWPHLGGAYRLAVGAYVTAIVAMCAMALARSAAPAASPWAAVGALAFAASDIAVARERFVRPALVNRLWGLPVYYAAQLLIAWTV